MELQYFLFLFMILVIFTVILTLYYCYNIKLTCDRLDLEMRDKVSNDTLKELLRNNNKKKKEND